MQLYLIRHGIAADRADYPDNDENRPLTDKGRQKTERVARRLYEMGVRFDLIVSSPLVRAYQTAEILQKAGLSQQIQTFTALAPNGDLQAWLNWRSQSRYNQEETSLALVGHQPDLGNWAEMLIWGSYQEKLLLKKAGVIGVILPETSTLVGNSQLFLLVSPKWLL